MCSDTVADLYRFTGKRDYQSLIKCFIRDYRFRYIACWRMVVKHSRFSSIAKIILKSLRKHYQIEIPYSVHIGSGFFMDHASGITINSNAHIGRNVTIYKGATIGSAISHYATRSAPTIGDEVYIGLNSTIVGGVKIGNDVLIAAGAFVNFDVPDHSVVIGNPAVIHEKRNATVGYLINILK